MFRITSVDYMNLEAINLFLQQQQLDIRISNDARFMDQKCTPDVISTVAECIQNYENNIFCVKDIWRSEFASKTVVRFFQKPIPTDEGSSSEYDKFFGQPIKMLSYAGILKLVPEHKGRSTYYKIDNQELLDYIAVRDRNAYDFLVIYLTQVLSQSNILGLFDDFFVAQDSSGYDRLKSRFERYIIQHTPINTEVEVRRIFTKILNPLAVEQNKAGTRGGRYSKDNIRYEELLYNRLNFRDLNKPKDMPRNLFLEQQPAIIDQEIYRIDKAKRQVKRYQGTASEVHPNLVGEANHAHHIFPQSHYIELSDTLENLIVLTAEEHFEFAHRKSSTSIISPGYQMICLLSKIGTIKKSLRKNDNFYSLLTYSNMLKVGLDTTELPKLKSISDQAANDFILFIADYYLNAIGSNPYKIDYSDFITISDRLYQTNSLIIPEAFRAEINNLFGEEVIKDVHLGTRHTLNIIAELAVQ